MKKNNFDDISRILDDKSITELDKDELGLIIDNIYSNIDNLKINKIINESLTEIIPFYGDNLKKPYWLKNNFDDDIWELNLNHANKKLLNFEIIKLDNGLPLCSDRKLVNTFKTWIVLSLSPKFNNGIFLSKSTIINRINIIINLINYLLINKHKLQLSKRHLSGINDNFIIETLITFTNDRIQDGLFNHAERVRSYLIEEIENISLEDVIKFEYKYPLIIENYTNKTLNLEIDQIRKARYFLFKKGAYQGSKGLYKHVRSNYFDFLLEGSIINPTHLKSKVYTDLNLSTTTSTQEYPYLPVRDEENSSSTSKYIMYYFRYIKILNFLKNFEECYHVKNVDFNKITLKRLQNLIELNHGGHYRTPPTIVVFPLLRNSLEFVFKYMDDILDSILKILNYCKENNIKHKSINENIIKKFCSNNLINIGLKSWNIYLPDKNRFEKIRKNEGLVNLYDVLVGCLQIIIGAVMARRQSEIIELSPINTLAPNINPEINCNQDFYINFHNRKSGISGEYDFRELITKPTPRSVAKLVYKLQQFNNKLCTDKLCSLNNLFLLNNISPTLLKISHLSSSNGRKLIDTACDYFETPLVKYTDNVICRYYIRQHQLRRFFTMMFFWSKSYSGLDTLRYFLGHTDIEHLYHYITEANHGEVLNGVKAQFLYHEISNADNHDIENIDRLRKKIFKHFNISQVDLFSEDDCLTLFPNNQECKDLRKIIPIQSYIESMLETHRIELYPDFFSSYNHDNEKIRDFKLIIKINEDWE